ncbi:recombinase family protein [Pseudomonas sp. p1(2021b)]|uniref:recombinase family protein n=1 Tax=Pseudomonas sp. p1(2021b) TaxID=2874628 RepID=UPI001CCFF2DB|nr:recombinase family protein [Pseudomonas sp. p1(2021b)]UBM24159.1 recombinase family protein [Pseudomonas sp. p1(2021b)]
MKIGYARVSTDEQNLALQIQSLKKAGCAKIFTDKGISGGEFQRPGLQGAIDSMGEGCCLVVWRLDRLGRSISKLIDFLEGLQRRRISFLSLNENIDTQTSSGRLVFHIMAALAEFEKGLISERTKAGMSAAKSKGKIIGRRPLLTELQKAEAAHMLCTQKIPLAQVAAHYNVHPRTIKRHVQCAAQKREGA